MVVSFSSLIPQRNHVLSSNQMISFPRSLITQLPLFPTSSPFSNSSSNFLMTKSSPQSKIRTLTEKPSQGLYFRKGLLQLLSPLSRDPDLLRPFGCPKVWPVRNYEALSLSSKMNEHFLWTSLPPRPDGLLQKSFKGRYGANHEILGSGFRPRGCRDFRGK